MAAKFKVLNQVQAIEPNAAGTGFENVWNITYRITEGPGKGTVATVQVPETEHNTQYVDKAIKEKIDAISGIASLGG